MLSVLIFIFLGAALLQKFDWIIYVFGAFLVYTGVKILFTKQHDEESSSQPIHLINKWRQILLTADGPIAKKLSKGDTHGNGAKGIVVATNKV